MELNLPNIIAASNLVSLICLLFGWFFIKTGKKSAHRASMALAILSSAVFLVFYLYYHYVGETVRYQGDGFLRYLYFFILITHISIAPVIPIVTAFSVTAILKGKNLRHKKIGRFLFPLWTYCCVTGLLIYSFVHL